MTDRVVLHGIGVSSGIASGPAVVVAPAVGIDLDEPASADAEVDGQRVREALDQVAAGLSERAANAEGDAKEILEATAALAKDRGLVKSIDKELKNSKGVTAAVHAAVEVYAKKLRKIGGYMAERVTDLYDIRDRATARLRGLPEPGIPDLTEPSIIVAHDLAPAETATLDRSKVLGIVTEAGGATSHTAILAAQLDIPAVVKVAGITESLIDATSLALDSSLSLVILAPTPEDIAELEKRFRRRAETLASSAGPGVTKDGHPVKLLANIGTAADAVSAAAFDLEGSGLFRTEFLFLGREEAPTIEEQTATYTAVLEAFGDRRVVVRTLDAGADKPLSFADLGPEENPALGKRGVRLTQVREELMDDQLAALAAAVFVCRQPIETPTGKFLGIVHIQEMLRHPPHEAVGIMLDTEVDPMPPDTSLAEVTKFLAAYNLVSVPITDDNDRLIGVVTVDDVLDELLPEDWRTTGRDDHRRG